MNLLGVTGTNGKTTTAYLTYQMLNMLNSKTGYIGTIGFYIPGEDTIEIDNTTEVEKYHYKWKYVVIILLSIGIISVVISFKPSRRK